MTAITSTDTTTLETRALAERVARTINADPVLRAARLRAVVTRRGDRVLVDCTRGRVRWLAAVVDCARAEWYERELPISALVDGRPARCRRHFVALVEDLGFESVAEPWFV